MFRLKIPKIWAGLPDTGILWSHGCTIGDWWRLLELRIEIRSSRSLDRRAYVWLTVVFFFFFFEFIWLTVVFSLEFPESKRSLVALPTATIMYSFLQPQQALTVRILVENKAR